MLLLVPPPRLLLRPLPLRPLPLDRFGCCASLLALLLSRWEEILLLLLDSFRRAPPLLVLLGMGCGLVNLLRRDVPDEWFDRLVLFSLTSEDRLLRPPPRSLRDFFNNFRREEDRVKLRWCWAADPKESAAACGRSERVEDSAIVCWSFEFL